jgi:hypothetical protein
MTITRRSLLASAPLLAGAAAFPQARPLIIGGPPPPTPPEIVNNCGNVFVSLAPKFAARTYTWADIQSFLATLATFNLQMGPFAFDNSVRAMAATINPYTISTLNRETNEGINERTNERDKHSKGFGQN